MKRLVTYVRVSTDKQGESGLGREAQRAAVRSYAERTGSKIVARFREVESGKRVDRPQLARAIEACRRLKATLVIAKLDRLARNVHFVSGLMESGVNFIAADMPDATPLQLHIYASFAEHEAKCISDRTKAALAALKARGVKLGGSHGARTAKLARKANSAAAQAHAESIRPLAERKRQTGWTLEQIAAYLTGKGLKTRRGKAFSTVAVLRLIKRH